MKSFTIGTTTYEVPDIGVDQVDPPLFIVKDGEFQGTKFSITDVCTDETDESLIRYTLETITEVDFDKFKTVVDNFIIQILHEELKRKASEHGME